MSANLSLRFGLQFHWLTQTESRRTMETSQVLERALTILGERGEGWSQRTWAFDADGFAIPTLDPNATRFCVNAAIARAIGTEQIGAAYKDAVRAVHSCIHANSVVVWNNDPNTCFTDVKCVLKRTIAHTQMRENTRGVFAD